MNCKKMEFDFELVPQVARTKKPKNFGLPYKGSKNKIAEELVELLPAGPVFVDLFAGGCAMTHAAIWSKKWDMVIANDIQKQYPELFLRAATGQLTAHDVRPISRNEFHAVKDSDAVAATCWSFGNDGKSYLWGKEKEMVMLAAFNLIMSEKRQDRYILLKKFIRILMDNGSLERLKSLGSRRRLELESLERLERLERLESISLEGKLIVSGKDYSDVNIPEGSVVYADPPYMGTTQYKVEFDHERFWEWCRQSAVPVYVSEYNAPSDFVSVFKKEKRCTFGDNSRNTIENLFVHQKFINKG